MKLIKTTKYRKPYNSLRHWIGEVWATDDGSVIARRALHMNTWFIEENGEVVFPVSPNKKAALARLSSYEGSAA